MKAELLAECVHCGFCLPTCPTYVLWHEEMDSPRGRIQLMEGLLDGEIPLSATVVSHFDACLGCVACVTACPSGVEYGRLIEETRAEVETGFRRPLGDRLLRSAVFAVFPHPRRLSVALRLAPLGRRLGTRRTRALAELAPRGRSAERPPELTPGAGPTVGLLEGCVQSVAFGDVNAATARVLAAEGFAVACPRDQGCCGALAVHGGRLADGLDAARRTIAALERYDLVVTNAAGCGSNLKDYGALLAGDPDWAERAAAFSAKVRDVSEVLAEAAAERRPLELRVAYQDACHLRHAQGITAEPRDALAAIPGLVRLEPAEQELCCGSAGIYNLVQPEAARELGDRKAAAVLATGAEALASSNPGCLIQLTAALRRAGRPLPAYHPIQLVDASIRGLGRDELLGEART